MSARQQQDPEISVTEIHVADVGVEAKDRFEDLCLVRLSDDWLDQVVSLDRLCYPNPWSRELFRREFEKSVSYAFGLSCGKELIAHCFNHLIQDEFHILNLAVLDRFRASGLGKKLLGFCLGEAILHGASYATLEVRASNIAAQRLYLGFGFRSVGMRRKYYNDNQEDALVFTRTLAWSDFARFKRQRELHK